MNPLIISTSDIDGGAARAAYRLHQSFQSYGVDSQMLVRAKFSADKAVTAYKPTIAKLGPNLDELPLRLYPQRQHNMYSLQWFPDAIAAKVGQIAPDIINLHWCCNGYLRVETIAKFKQPIVWTLHDMWAFTGGCHYNQQCDRYVQSCGKCPQLDSSNNWDLSRWVWQRKLKAWKNLNLTIVTPSNWLAAQAKSSSLFKHLRIEVIPYSIDTESYQPIERQIARRLLNLPMDKQLVFCATSDRRKGFHLLCPALELLSKSGWKDKIELVVFGSPPHDKQLDIGVKVHYLGRFNDDAALRLVYCAGDVFVAPSIQDNLPNTVIESLSCATPCVAFNIGGLPDLIEHERNGYLAQPYEVDDLAKGIAWILESKDRHQKLSDRARSKAESEFTLELQARRYMSLFTELVN